jgi:hypothetical protein
MGEKVTVSQVSIKYGLVTGLVLVVYNLALYMTGLFTNDKLGWITYVILIVMIYLAHKAFKDGGDGFMTLGQGLGVGMLVTVIGGVITSLFSYFYIKFVDETIIEQILEVARVKMEEQGLDDDQIDQALSISEKMMTPEMMVIWGILGMVIIGFVIALIVSLFTKKNNPEAQY